MKEDLQTTVQVMAPRPVEMTRTGQESGNAVR